MKITRVFYKNILKRDYSAEELCDIEDDISWALEVSTKEIPVEDTGFQKGVFTLSIEYREEY